jgi:hypothetical protein
MKLQSIITIGLLAGGVLCAQPPHNRATATPPTPAQMPQRETDRLTKFFTLTAPQQITVLGILTTADMGIQAITPQIQLLQTALVGAIKGNNGSISSIVAQISSLQEQEQVIRANAANQIYTTVLTATQQAQVGNGLGPLMGGWGPGFGGRGPGGIGPAGTRH